MDETAIRLDERKRVTEEIALAILADPDIPAQNGADRLTKERFAWVVRQFATYGGKRPCESGRCGSWTTLVCGRCMRHLCKAHGAINLKTMIHSDGNPCTGPHS